MNKGHIKGTYEINQISCFNDKMYIQNNWYDGLRLSYISLSYIYIERDIDLYR